MINWYKAQDENYLDAMREIPPEETEHDYYEPYEPNRKGFKKFLIDTMQTDTDGFYEQWLIDNFSNLDCDLKTYAERLRKAAK